MYRPQFFNPTPKGYKDEPYVKPVTYGQNINGLILPGQQFLNYIIQMDNDAPTLVRSIFWEGGQQGQGVGSLAQSCHVQLVNAFNVDLTDGFIPLWLYAWGAGSTPPDGGSGRAKVFEPELFCPPGSVLKVNYLLPDGFAGNIPSFAGPFVQSPSHTAVQMENYPVGGQGQGAPVISYNGALYQLLQRTGYSGAAAVGMWQSTNNGSTWHQLDSANGPSRSTTPVGGAIYDGGNIVTVASSLGSRITPGTSAVFFQDFDLSTGLWSAPYGTTGAPVVYGVNQIHRRSDGSIVVIAADGVSPDTLKAYVFAGGAWTTSVSLTSGLPGGWASNSSSSSVYDPSTGLIHVFGIAFAGLVKKQFYEQITAANTVTGFQDLTALYSAASAMGSPVIVGNHLVWGAMDTGQTYATIIYGSPLSAPVFSILASPGVLPSQPIPGFPNTMQPTLGFDGSVLWATFSGDGTQDIIYLAFTTNLSDLTQGWQGGIAYQDPAGAIFGGLPQYPSVAIINSLPYLTFQVGGFGEPQNYFFLPSQGPINVPGLFELRGVKRYVEGCIS